MVDGKLLHRIMVWPTYDDAIAAEADAASQDCKRDNKLTVWDTYAQAAAHTSINSGGGYVAEAVHLDGSSQLISNSPLAGISNAEKGILAFWWKSGESTSDFRFMATTADYKFELDWPFDPDLVAQDTILILANSGTDQFSFFPITSFSLASGWTHFLFAWDTGHLAGEKVLHCVVNGTLIDHSALNINDANGSITVDYSTIFSAFGDANIGYQPIGDSADWYFAPGQFLDLSIEANRLKFIDVGGKPVDLGANGETPTGTAPAVFFSGDATGFATNKGTGGAFSLTGSLTNASTSPSD
jgi:hypothetical protein